MADAAPTRNTTDRGPPAQALPLLAGVALALLAGVAGGLVRAGVGPPGVPALAQATVWHGALMVGGFFGTVIGIERAVALRAAVAWASPACSASATLALLAGHGGLGLWLLVAAAGAFVLANLLLVRRQPARHTVLLLGAAVAWLSGNLLAAGQAPAHAVLPWWFAFLVVTVTAERLEMTRLLPRRAIAMPALALPLALLLCASMLSLAAPVAAGVAYGLGLTALAAWLMVFDIARVTVRTTGLPRYMAVCLLGGYVWLAVGGLAWAGHALAMTTQDAAIHAVALGFLGSMVMGHAPVILPAVARIRLAHGPLFYAPLAALHVSLAARVFAAPLDTAWRTGGALFNALSLAAFVATVVAASRAARRRAPTHTRPRGASNR